MYISAFVARGYSCIQRGAGGSRQACIREDKSKWA